MFGAMTTKDKLRRMRADRRRKMILLGAGGTVCAVCGGPKNEGWPLCDGCLGTLGPADRDILTSSYEGFRQVVEALRPSGMAPEASGRPTAERISP
jgi:hypothetical protein